MKIIQSTLQSAEKNTFTQNVINQMDQANQQTCCRAAYGKLHNNKTRQAKVEEFESGGQRSTRTMKKQKNKYKGNSVKSYQDYFKSKEQTSKYLQLLI